MKVLHYVDDNSVPWLEPWLQLLLGLQKEGVESTFICRPGGDVAHRVAARGLPVQTYLPRASWFPQGALGLGSILKKERPQIIHTRLSQAALLGGYWGKRLGIPVVSTVDKFAKPKYYTYAQMLLPCSSSVARHLLNQGFPASKVQWVPNVVDTAYYKLNSSFSQTLRKERSIPSEALVVLGAGRMEKSKGFKELIEAFRIVLENQRVSREIVLCLGGDGQERQALENQVENLGMKGKVHFLGFLGDIRPALQGADVFVHAAWEREAFGLIVLEAMASGLPCIATNNGGIPDMISHEETGLLVPGGDISTMAKAMERLLLDSALRSFVGCNALKKAQKFDVSQVRQKLYRIYQHLGAVSEAPTFFRESLF